MSEDLIEVTFVLGTVELGRPTGHWIKDADGWSRQEMTDTITRDHYGLEVSRRKTPTYTRIMWPHDQPKERPWWAFWLPPTKG